MGKGIFEIFVCMVFFFFSIRKSVIMDSMSKEKKGKETENQIEEKRSQIKISVRNLVEFISGKETLTTGMDSLFHRKQC